eukprot:GSMAST32.ASY1.ANO1.1135.1 assembled CDS
MRRRNLLKTDSISSVSAAQSVLRYIPKKLDVYPKLEESIRIRTKSGATLSLVMMSIGFLLFISESIHYFTPKLVDIVEVDSTIDDRLRIDLHITFPALPCSKVNVVAMDVAGEHQLDVDHEMHKTSIDVTGKLLGETVQSQLNHSKEINDHQLNRNHMKQIEIEKNAIGCTLQGFMDVFIMNFEFRFFFFHSKFCT